VSAPGWPVVLRDAGSEVVLRPPRLRDGVAWQEVRTRCQTWLEPWEATAPEVARVPWAERQSLSTWGASLHHARRQAKLGAQLLWAVTEAGRFAGMVSLGSVSRGAARSAQLGYWVDARVAGRGVGSVAVALACDHAFGPVGLHRLEAWVRPDNARSSALLASLGFRAEGRAVRGLAVDGAWRDHVVWALLADEVVSGSVLGAWRSRPTRRAGAAEQG